MADYTLSVEMTFADKTSKGLDAVGKKLKSLGKGLQKAGVAMTAGVTAPVVALGAVAINAASDLEESYNKVMVVFDDSASVITDYAKTSAKSLGMTEQSALEAAGTYGNLFTAMEIGPDVAADMSVGLLGLAADLASFNNMSPDEVLDKLRAGLVGEVEPLRALGVNLNQATIAAKAMELGLVDVEVNTAELAALQVKASQAQEEYNNVVARYGPSSEEAILANADLAAAQTKVEEALAGTVDALTPAQKTQAAYALIMEQTTNAQGDFSRTSDGLANSTRILKAQFGDMAANLGSVLLPVVQQVVNFISSLVEKFTALSPETQKIIVIFAGIAAAIGPVLLVVGSLVSALGTILPIIGSIVGVISGPLVLAIGAIIGIVAALVLAWQNNWGGIRDVVATIWNENIKPAIDSIISTFRDVLPIVLQGASDLWLNVLQPALQTVAGFISENVLPVLGKIIQWLLEQIPPAIEWAANFFTGTLVPALTEVWQFISEKVVPILQAVWDWLEVNIPAAITTVSGYWENTLKPALQTVWDFISTKIFPIFQQVWDWLELNIPAAINTASSFWENTLKPALEAVWGFMQDELFPVLEDIAEIIGIGMQIAIEVGKLAWEKLQPVLETIWGVIKDDLLPIIEDIAEFISDTFGPVVQTVTDGALSAIVTQFRTLRDIAQKVWTWLGKVLEKIKAIASSKLGILQQHSPSPFEQALLDVASASEMVVNGLQNIMDQVNDMDPILRIFDDWKTDFEGVVDLASKFGSFAKTIAGNIGVEGLDAAMVRYAQGILKIGDKAAGKLGVGGILEKLRTELGWMEFFGSWAEAKGIEGDILKYEQLRAKLENDTAEASQLTLESYMRIYDIQQKMAQLDFLKQQMDLIKAVKDAGIDARVLFQGITLGLGASVDDMLRMTDLALTELLAKAEAKLEIGSPSGVGVRWGMALGEGVGIGWFKSLGAVGGDMDLALSAIGSSGGTNNNYYFSANYSRYQDERSLMHDIRMVEMLRRG